MKNVNDGFLKSIFKFSISTWVNFLIGIISSFISTRIVSPEIYGLFNIFNTTVTMVMYFTSLGLDASLLRFYNEPPKGENKKIFTFKLMLISTISTAVVAIIIISFFNNIFSESVYGYASYYLTVMTFISVIANLILRYLNIIYRMTFNAKQYTIQNILIQTITRFCIIGAILLSPTFNSVVLVQVLGLGLLAIIYLFVQRKGIFPNFKNRQEVLQLRRFDDYKNVIKFALFSSPTYIVTNLNVFLSQQIIRLYVGASALGIYSSASYFVTILSVANGGFSTFWSAYVYANYKEHREKISMMHDYVLFLISLMYAGMMLFKDVIYLFIGSAFHASKVFVSLILVASLFEIISQTTVYGINIMKKNHILLNNYIIQVLLNLVLSLLFITKYGLIGVALASMIAATITFFLNTYFGQKYYSTIRNKAKSNLVIISIIVIAMANLLIQNRIIISVIMILYILLLLLIYKNETIYIIKMIFSLFRRKNDDIKGGEFK